jgi:hypothetical protein
MAVKLRKYQRFFHFSIARGRLPVPSSFTVRGRAQGPNPRRSVNHLPTTNTHQRIKTMAKMKKKGKAKKAAKK